jgi:hypothetical protein
VRTAREARRTTTSASKTITTTYQQEGKETALNYHGSKEA